LGLRKLGEKTVKEENKKSDVNALYNLVMECKKKNSISDAEMLDILVNIVASLKSIDIYLAYLANNQAGLQEQIEGLDRAIRAYVY
jgi:hypothetical protein